MRYLPLSDRQIINKIGDHNKRIASRLGKRQTLVCGGITMKAIIPILLFPFFFSLAHADIRPHHSGAWYNQDQSGHGLSIQVLDDERTIAFWFAYTPDGLPMFLVIDGVNDGHTVTGPAYYYEGMIWRQFDPATLNSEVWVKSALNFSDVTAPFYPGLPVWKTMVTVSLNWSD